MADICSLSNVKYFCEKALKNWEKQGKTTCKRVTKEGAISVV